MNQKWYLLIIYYKDKTDKKSLTKKYWN
jgi:hypothetical protein